MKISYCIAAPPFAFESKNENLNEIPQEGNKAYKKTLRQVNAVLKQLAVELSPHQEFIHTLEKVSGKLVLYIQIMGLAVSGNTSVELSLYKEKSISSESSVASWQWKESPGKNKKILAENLVKNAIEELITRGWNLRMAYAKEYVATGLLTRAFSFPIDISASI